MSAIDRKFVRPVGFSNGSAPLALKKPPPFVPSCLMTSCDAIGPRGMTWLAPLSASVMCTAPEKVSIAPSEMKMIAAKNAIGSRT